MNVGLFAEHNKEKKTFLKMQRKREPHIFSWCDIIYGLQSEELCFLFDSIVYIIYNSCMENWAAILRYIQSFISRVFFCAFVFFSSYLGERFLRIRSIFSCSIRDEMCRQNANTRHAKKKLLKKANQMLRMYCNMHSYF